MELSEIGIDQMELTPCLSVGKLSKFQFWHGKAAVNFCPD